jgi:hypothetical protein
MARVLIADELSPRAVDIFRSRGVDVDVKIGLRKPDLLKIIGEYDGLAARSATKADKEVIAAAGFADEQLDRLREGTRPVCSMVILARSNAAIICVAASPWWPAMFPGQATVSNWSRSSRS